MTAATTLRDPAALAGGPGRPRDISPSPETGDRVFNTAALATGLLVLLTMAAVGLFLGGESVEALRSVGLRFLTIAEWEPGRAQFGIAAVLLGTVLIALVAVTVAIPVSLGTSLFIAEIAPPKVRPTLVAIVDLMAAVPSVVYGLWGRDFLQDKVVGLSRWLTTWFGWIPIFDVEGADPSNPLANASVFSASTFIAGLVVALMVIPIQTSIMREVFSQVPAGEREGAFALGASRWGMIRMVSVPFGRGGIIGGTMLGLGRALGETIAVYLIISPHFDLNLRILEAGSNSVSSHIALRFNEATGFELSALMAAGLALFVITLIVNFTAATFVARSRSGAASEA